MKWSVSLPDEDRGTPSRSAVLQHAVAMVRQSQLAESYADAFSEWDESPNANRWESAAGDGWT